MPTITVRKRKGGREACQEQSEVTGNAGWKSAQRAPGYQSNFSCAFPVWRLVCQPMEGDLVAPREPDIAPVLRVGDEPVNGACTTRTPGDAAMETDGHHLRRACALVVE